MKTIAALRQDIAERKGWSLADENRDSKLFLNILDDLAQHIDRLEREYLPDR